MLARSSRTFLLHNLLLYSRRVTSNSHSIHEKIHAEDRQYRHRVLSAVIYSRKTNHLIQWFPGRKNFPINKYKESSFLRGVRIILRRPKKYFYFMRKTCYQTIRDNLVRRTRKKFFQYHQLETVDTNYRDISEADLVNSFYSYVCLY